MVACGTVPIQRNTGLTMMSAFVCIKCALVYTVSVVLDVM